MRRLLTRLFDVERSPGYWDLRVPWPAMRLYHRRKFTTSGVEHRLGLYRRGSFEHAIEWWVGG